MNLPLLVHYRLLTLRFGAYAIMQVFLWDLRCSGPNSVPSMRLTASDGIAERSKTVGMVTALDTAIIKNVGPDSNVSNTVGVSVEDRQGGVCGTSQAIVVGGYEDGSVCLFDLRMTK